MGVKSGNRAAAPRTMRVTTWRFMRIRRRAVEPAILRRNLTRRLLSGVGVAALLAGASLALLPAPARADTSWTGAVDGDWHNAANWSNGVPSNTDNDAYITGPETAIISQAASGENWTWVGHGNGNSGAISVGDGGSLTAGCCFYLGGGGGTGTMTVSGTGTVTTSSIFMLGDYGSTGHLTIENGGTVNSGYATYVGRYNGSSGYATVTGENSLWSVSGSTLWIAGESTGSLSAYGSVTLADSGVLRVNGGSGTVVIGNAANSTAFLNIGAAQGDAAAAAGGVEAGNISLGNGDGTLVFNHIDPGLAFSTRISGNGEVHQIAGTTILSGSNTWSGSTVVDGGTLRAGSATGLSNYSGYEVNGGTLDLNDFDLTASELSGTSGTVDLGSAELEVDQDSDSVFGGLIAGTGSLVKLGSGILSLTGANTFSGGTTLGEGTLRLEDDDAIGTGALTVTGGTLDYDDGIDLSNDIDLRAQATLNVTTGSATQSGNIGETGGSFDIVKSGAGTLELTGTNSYTGVTTVSAGTLRAGSATGFASGGYVLDGGTLDLNDFDLTMSSLSGTSGTVDLGSAELEVDQDGDSIFGGIVSGAGSLVKLGTGVLTLTGTNTFSGGTTLGEGTLRLEDDGAIGSGALTATGGTLDYDDGIGLSNGIDLQANTNLNVATGAATQSGNIGETGGSFGIVKTGAGTLELTGANTYTGSTTVENGTLRAGGASAFISGGTYTVNDGTLDLNDLDLTMSSLSGTGGTVDLGSAELEVDQNSDSIFGGIVSGAGSLVKLGSGVLSLTGANTFSGGTTLGEGTLRLEDEDAIGSGALTATGGTLDYDSGIDLSNDIDLQANTNLNVTTGSATQSGTIGETGGSFGIVKTGAGTLELTGVNTYTGDTTISGGTLKGSTASLTGDIVNNAALAFDQASDGSFAGIISGTGTLEKTGAGTLELTGANIYSGGTTISAGTLQGSTASLAGDIVNNAALAFDQASDGIFSGVISGTGNLSKTGAGILTLSGANTFSGGTTISAGTLKGSTATLTGDIVNNATLAFEQASDGSFSGVVSGTGTLEKSGAGILTLSGANTYTGGTTIAAGTLRAGAAGGLASGAYTLSGGTLDLNDFDLSVSSLSGTSGTVALGNAELEVDQDSDSVFGGIVSGAGSLVKLGSGVLSLTGTNTYTGATTVSGGTLRAGGATGLASGGYVLDGGTLDLNDFDLSLSSLSGTGGTVDLGSAELEVDQDSDSVFGGLIAGAGSLVKLGSGVLSLTGANTFSDGTTLEGGTLALQHDEALGTGGLMIAGGTTAYGDGVDIANAIDLRAGATFDVGDGEAATQSGNIGETGGSFGIVKSGIGSLELTGASSFTGGITVNGGDLIGNTASLVGDIGITGGTVEFDQASAGAFTGEITGTGRLVKSGEGETVFSGSGIEADYFYVRGMGAVLDGVAVDIANRLDISNQLESGGTTDADLTIRGGANVTSFSGVIGDVDDFEAAVTVSGVGTAWTVGEVVDPTVFRIAGKGAASLLVEEGAEVAVIGSASVHSLNGGAASSVAITGENSLFDVSGLLDIGGAGTGELTVSNGGSVRSGSAQVGRQSVKTGIVAIAGEGSEWLIDGSSLGLGGNDDSAPGTGHLTLADDGLLRVGGGTGTLHAALGDGSTARINIGAAEGEDAAAAGTLDLAAIAFDADGGGDGRLLFNHTATDYLFGALLEGAGAVSHTAGVTTLTGLSTAFTGVTSVTGGQLNVDGTLGGSVSVSNARLGGSGTVGGTTLQGGGILSPGNSIGTLAVSGDLEFGDGSFYEVEVDDGGDTAGVNADFVHVTGAATIGSGAVVEVAPANGTDDGTTYAPSTVYRVLTADGGISGVFGGVTAGFAFLTPELSYDATSVFLTLTQMAAFEDVASTSNQQGVAGATEALGAGNPLYDEIIGMSDEEAQAAFDALSGEAHASSAGVFSGSAGIVRRTIFSRLFSRFGAPRGFAAAEGYVPAAGDETPHGYTLWGELVRGWGETDGSASVAGIERNATGFFGGVDREVGVGSRIGFALGYSHAAFDVSGRSSSGESDNFHIAGYAGTELGPVDLKAVLGYSYQMAESRRRVVVGGVLNDLSADYGAHTFQASGEASLDLEVGSVTLTPFAGLAVVHVETEAFTETGGPAALFIASSDNTTGISELGLRAARQAGSLTLFGSASWRHAFGDVEPLSRAAFVSAPATTFSVRGTPLSEDVASLGGGVEFLLAEATTLEFSYRGEFASDSRDHGLKTKLRIDF